MVPAALLGFGFGFVVALQVGPISLLLIRSTLRAGWRVGVAIGAGIALYAACGAAGVGSLLAVAPFRATIAIVGAIVLVVVGVRTLHSAFRVRGGAEFAAELATPERAFLTAAAATASNPATSSWAAIFAAANASRATGSPAASRS